MSLKDLLIVLFSLYGAILSTILAVQKFILEKKKINIFLIETVMHPAYKIEIVNVRKRPITIKDIHLYIEGSNELIPSYERFEEEFINIFPFTLTDGQTNEIWLSDFINNELKNSNENRMQITVFDAEGNEFKKYEKKTFNEKFSMFEISR